MSGDRPPRYADDDDVDRPPYDEDYGEETAYNDDRTLPGFLPFGWPAMFNQGTTDERHREGYDEEYGRDYERERQRDYEREDEGTWLDEGLISLTIVAGVILFLFPEPGTSALGILLITVGVVAWVVDWAMS